MIETATDTEVQCSEPQRAPAPALGTSGAGEEKGVERTVVALSDTARDRSTRTTSPEAARICLMAYDTLGCYMVTSRGRIIFQTEQVKVRVRSEERTVVQIEYGS